MKAVWTCCAVVLMVASMRADEPPRLGISWKDNYLTVSGPQVPGKEIKVLYLEAYCRAGSTKRDWKQTVIRHKTKLVSDEGGVIHLQCALTDGVIVDHEISATADTVNFKLVAHNPTDKPSEVDWGQPCIRVDGFTGRNKDTYLDKCFIFQDGRLQRMPTEHWATEALYVPGQVWAAKGINRDDVNPRPLNPRTPDNSLIGCFSADEKMILAIAFEPNQELFQGVYACLHSDFRIGGVKPGESKTVRGKLYLVPADVEGLVKRWGKDFGKQEK
jgi:hypothetical protein